MHAAALTCHPSTLNPGIDRFYVHARIVDASTLWLRYRIEGDSSRVRTPARVASCRRERLWQHTCMEAFVRTPGSSGYCEFNFAPSTEWALYGFTGYRQGMRPLETGHPPHLGLRCDARTWELEVLLGGFDELVPIREYAPLMLGVSAVIETPNGEFSYWALRHPKDHPDFHHPDSFSLALSLSAP